MNLEGNKVGWVGTGNMGSPMSRCLIGAGARLAVFDPVADNLRASRQGEQSCVVVLFGHHS